VTADRPQEPDPDEGPLDPFVDDAPLAAGTHDDDLLRAPSVASRLLSSFIDLMAAYLVINVLDAVVIIAAVHPGAKLTVAQQRDELVAFIGAAMLVAVGFVLLERYTGRSLGKRLLRLRLVTRNGSRPTVRQLAVRYLVMVGFTLFVLAIFSVSLGSLLVIAALAYAAVQPQRRNIFDVVTGTRVVSDTT
jgi:uncharacterized RDD family membrane protein YckC